MITSALEAVRIVQGATQSALAARSGVSQSAISKAESGLQELSEGALKSLSDALDAPAALLGMRSQPSWVRHAPRGAVSAKAMKRVSAEFALALLRVQLLVGDIRHDIEHRPLGDELASARAMNLRRTWQVGPGPIEDIVRLTEKHGIICLYRDLASLRTSALAATDAAGHTVMFIDPRPNADAAGWAVAHELGHLALHGTDSADEQAAEEFAGEFLAPRSELRARHEAGADSDILIQEYAVPPAQFARHARHGRLITVADYRRLRTLHSTGAGQLAWPSYVAEAVQQRIRTGETLDQIAASACLTTQDLLDDYLTRRRARG